MTVTTETNTTTADGNGVTTSFPFNFPILETDHIQIIVTTSTGVETVLSTSQYSVVFNADNTGTVTYPVSGDPLPTGDSITITRIVPYKQTLDITNTGGFNPSVTEDTFDLIVMMAQQLSTGVQLRFLGDYSGSTQYLKFDIVISENSSWVALQTTTGNAPPTLPTRSNDYWVLLAKVGNTGAPGADGTSVTISDTAPASPVASQRWLDSTTLRMYTYYNDGSSSQWVETATPQIMLSSYDTRLTALETNDATQDTDITTLQTSVNWVYPASQATTSGTEFDFTSIPSGVSEIEIPLDGVSLSGTDDILIQIGDSGGFETSGYESASAFVSSAGTAGTTLSTAGFIIRVSTATRLVSGVLRLSKVNSEGTKWNSTHGVSIHSAGTGSSNGGGLKTLSGELTQVRLTRTGSNTFDSGEVSVRYR